jgi:DUF1009 family protein
VTDGAGRGKIALISGGGGLPIALAQTCQAVGRPYLVLRLRGFADPALAAHPGEEVGMAELGRQFDILRRECCEAICLSGLVQRPDFSKLKPDLRGMRSLPGAIAAAAQGDDALLRFVITEYEREGFRVEGAQEVAGGLLLSQGPLGAVAPDETHQSDIALAVRAARTIGDLDAGQAAAAAKGVILALEAQEGTDAMLRRCAELPPALRGTAALRVGVIAKWPKPTQERRIDLPTIGVKTLEGAAAAGFAGVVSQAGGALVIERDAVIAAADRLGLFVYGLETDA